MDADVKSDVSQESVLSSLLFKIYVNAINNIGLFEKMSLYADDLCVLYPYHKDVSLKAAIERDAKYIKVNK